MPSESILRMRITEAAKDAERALKNKDTVAYYKAASRYKQYDAQLRELEKARNDKAIAELEARAKNGELSYVQVMRAGVPPEVLLARGWESLPDRSVFRKSPSQEAG